MHKLLTGDGGKREREGAENGKADSKERRERRGRPEAKVQDPNRPAKKKKLFPHSVLFKTWGGNLSESEQREAEALFQKYGYNAFLSDRLPLDRPLPDTRDPR